MPKKMSLGFNIPQEFPTLLNTAKGPVLAIDVNAYLTKDGNGFSWFGAPDCTDRWASSQQDREQIVSLIRRLDDESAFSSTYNEWIPRCLELSYLIELVGSRPEFWEPAMSPWADEFLDQTFQGLTGYSVDDALNAVRPLQEWPAGRRFGVEKLRAIIQAGPVSTGLLSFTTRAVVFCYRCKGMDCVQYLGFKDYMEMDTDSVSQYEWYSACWKHLFYQLLAACGVRCDDLQFICAEGVTDFEDYHWDGEGMKPHRVSNPAYLLELLEERLWVLKD